MFICNTIVLLWNELCAASCYIDCFNCRYNEFSKCRYNEFSKCRYNEFSKSLLNEFSKCRYTEFKTSFFILSKEQQTWP